MLHDMDFVPHQPWMDRNEHDTILDLTLEHYLTLQYHPKRSDTSGPEAWFEIAATMITSLVSQWPELNQDLSRRSTAKALVRTNLQGFTSLLQSIRDKEKTWGDFRALGD
jgi:hypothetical protein